MDYDSKVDKTELDKRIPHYFEPFDINSAIDDSMTIRVATTLSHFNDTIKQTLESISPVEIMRLGGAGNKVNRLVLNEVDEYAMPTKGLKFWDLCAPEPLIRAMGGVITDPENKRIVYKEELNGGSVSASPAYISKTHKVH